MERIIPALLLFGGLALGFALMANGFKDGIMDDFAEAYLTDKTEEAPLAAGEVHAQKAGVLYHESREDFSRTVIANGLLDETPDLAQITMVEGARQFSTDGISSNEVYTTLLYVHGEKPGGRFKVYANQCTLEAGEISGEIMYTRPDVEGAGFESSIAGKEEVLALLSQRNCEILFENGTFDALKAEATAAQDREGAELTTF